MHGSKHGKIQLHPVQSTSLHSIGYEPDRKELHVKFRSGEEGHYNGVDQNTFAVLLAAPSKGKALHHLIKKYPKKYPWASHKK